ncbi:hypothetical protein [Streptomyces sp. NPDC047123]|uniref:hypothetical protein n=1 Tax=Streptomyces sp. NPDC047123 TaxID=3155622 RepID=UPI0033E52E30
MRVPRTGVRVGVAVAALGVLLGGGVAVAGSHGGGGVRGDGARADGARGDGAWADGANGDPEGRERDGDPEGRERDGDPEGRDGGGRGGGGGWPDPADRGGLGGPAGGEAGLAAAFGPGAGVVGRVEREADLAFHGEVSVRGGTVRVRFVPQNHGPSDLADATLRLRWSLPVKEVPRLPEGCLRSGAASVLCRTGALDADTMGESVEIVVRVAGRPGEVGVRIGTDWNGGAADLNPRNNEHAVLALDTGDTYYF